MGRFRNLITRLRYMMRAPDFLSGRKKKRQALRERWGRELDIERDFSLIAAYHELTAGDDSSTVVDDKTWRDLNMDDVFRRLDRTVSTMGRQHLYRGLRTGGLDRDEAIRRNELYELFRNDSRLREETQLALSQLDTHNAGYIIHLILDKIPSKPLLFPLIYLSSLLTVATSLLLIFTQQFFYIPLLLAVVNIIVHAVYSNRMYRYFPGLSYLNSMLGVALVLAKTEGGERLPQILALNERAESIKKMRKAVGWMVIDRARLDDLTDSVVEYLNLICLFDVVAFIRSIDGLRKYRRELAEIFEQVGSLDSTLSSASWIESLPHCCCPELTEDGDIELDEAYHILLENPVANSFNTSGHSALITGSNMAGKTTFIKTIGVAAILGRSLGVVPARRAMIPQLAVRSSMRREDALSEGQSYYFAEVEALREFIASCNGGSRYLFLIDEIYRGTNTIERISSATAVLNFLARRNLVMVTTHDIELQNLLGERYRMYHFSEQVDGEQFFFDYKLKNGPTRTRNAIKLLELSAYPSEIISRASELAVELSSKYKDL